MTVTLLFMNDQFAESVKANHISNYIEAVKSKENDSMQF